MMFSAGDNPNPEESRKMRDLMGPQAVDQTIRQAITLCWMMLPEGNKSVAGVEAEIRRLTERALKDLKEDAKSFGVPPD